MKAATPSLSIFLPQGKDEVFEFLESVLSEVTALFPFEYVHIGGDECPKARWRRCADCQRRIKEVRTARGGCRPAASSVQLAQPASSLVFCSLTLYLSRAYHVPRQEGLSGEDQLQSWFISRIARHLAKLGKRIIGAWWDGGWVAGGLWV